MTAKKTLLIDCLHVFVLTHFALVQPLLYRLSRKTVYLDDQGIERGTVFLLVALLSVVAPAVIWLIELLADRFGPRGHTDAMIVGPDSGRTAPAAGTPDDAVASARTPRWRVGLMWLRSEPRERTHGAIVFLLFTAILLPVLKSPRILPGMLVVALAPILAALGLFAYRRIAAARLFVSAAAPVFLVFPAQFLFFSAASRYLFPLPASPPSTPIPARNPVPVVMLIFDEFCGTTLMNRRGEIDSTRYPNFAALAETATWYRNASSVHPRTEMAVPAILSGRYPRGRRPATVAEYPTNLFTLMEPTGQYEFVVFEPYTRLYRPILDDEPREPKSRREQWSELAATLPLVYLDHLLPVDVPILVPTVPMVWNARKQTSSQRLAARTGVFRYHWNSDRAEQFDEFLERIKPPDQPTLYFSHLVVPHAPWCFLPSGRRYTQDNGRAALLGTSEDGETWSRDELAALHGYQRYLLQVGYVDRLLGKLMARLRAAELFDRSLLVVTADHGLSFRPGLSRRLPEDESLPDIASIPLFVKLPGQREGRTSDRNVESIDVLPTIVDVLGLEATPETDGSSLVDPARPERAEKFFCDDARKVTLDAAFPSKQTTLARMLDQFGDGVDEPDRLFRIGPHSELIGHAAAEFAVPDRAGVRLKLIDPIAPNPVYPAPIVPCYFSGRVLARDATGQPIVLAIAVNGTIRAVTRTYSDREFSDAWCALLPESSLDAAENDVQIFVVTTANSRVTLRPALDSPLHFRAAN